MLEGRSDSYLVRQANALAKSGQELDLVEKRLLLIAMSRIKRSDTELLTHRIYVSEVNEYFGGDPWRAAQKAATGLLKRVVYIKGEDGAFTAFNWTTLARYVPASQSEDGNSYIEIRLNQELAPLLLQLRERYNTIPLLDILPIPSVNSQRLYEILWHDSHGGSKDFLTYDLSTLKFQLGLRVLRTIKGRETWTEKYKTWRDFQKVLKRAQLDFEQYGALRFTFEGITVGRTTQQVRFCVTLAQPSQLPILPIDVSSDPELQLREIKVTEALERAGYLQDPSQTIRAYGLEVVEMALKLAREAERNAARSNKPIINLGGLIHHSLKTGLAKRRLERHDEATVEPSVDPKALARHLIDAFDTSRTEFAERFWMTMSPNERDSFPDIMRLELSSLQVAQLEKANWQGNAFESARNYLILALNAEQLPQHLLEITHFVSEEGLLDNYQEDIRHEVLREAQNLL